MADDDDKDEKVTNMQQQGNQQKDPKKKLREEFEKEWTPKLGEQRKKTVNAIRAANNEKKALRDLLGDYSEESESFNNALKDIA